MPAGQTIVDGSVAFSGGVDSIKATTVASENNPQGLLRSQLAWLNNGGVRDGGILQRTGFDYKGRISDGSALYQGGWMYDAAAAYPYLVLSIGGHIYQVDVDSPDTNTDLSAAFSLVNPANPVSAYFCQAEEFLVIQAGDNLTLPLFWDGATLRRSIGITNPTIGAPAPGVNEIPAATCMDYYMGRLWYAQGRVYAAGDIVKSHNSGTAPYQFRDSVLNVTESPLCFGGDGFTVPDNAGYIRALFHNANLNAALGQGQLMIGTRKAIYSLQVPVTRSDWIAVTSNNIPQQIVVQLINGPVNDRSIVKVNGDIFFQSLEPSIRSLMAAVRYFQQWANISISANENRILQYNDRALLSFASGILYNNRLLQTALPKQTAQGVVHQALIPMDYMPVSSFGANLTPVWEGMWEGLDIFQMFVGDFGGRERAFAVVRNRKDAGIDLWEFTDFLREDKHPVTLPADGVLIENSDENRVDWQIEFPAYNWGREFDLKRLISAELWIDKLFGAVDFEVEYRPDGDVCWHKWFKWTMCSARTSCENVYEPVCYPLQGYRESFRSTVTLPKPPDECQPVSNRPVNLGYQFQPRLTIKGWCRIRGILLHAELVERKLYSDIPPLR